MNYNDVITEFFECYNLVKLFGIENIHDTNSIFLSNNYFNMYENENSSDSDN